MENLYEIEDAIDSELISFAREVIADWIEASKPLYTAPVIIDHIFVDGDHRGYLAYNTFYGVGA